MSLIKCPECGKMISEYATYCINCGCPMDKIKVLSKAQKKASIKKAEKKVKEVKQDRVVQSSFLYSRDEVEQKFMLDVVKCVQNSIENSVGKDHPYKYSIRIKLGEENYKTLGWFRANDNKEMVFRYYKGSNSKEDVEEFVARTKLPQEVAGILIKICRNESNSIEEEKTGNLVSDDFYNALVASLQGRRKILYFSSKQKLLVQDITKFVFDDVCANAISNKIFKSKEDFYKFKTAYYYTPVFFGNAFSFRNFTKRVLNMFIAYYVSAQIAKKIKEYEKLYNEKIICNYTELLKDYANMLIKSKNICYSNSSGITSNIVLIPETTLNNICSSILSCDDILDLEFDQ